MNISNIINYLNTIPAITSIVGNRIFWGIPKTEQTLDYITINIITEGQYTEVEKRNRVEFRYIGGSSNTSYSTLQVLDNLILQNMRNYKQDGIYKTVILNFENGYDEKQRKVMIRDLFIYYII